MCACVRALDLMGPSQASPCAPLRLTQEPTFQCSERPSAQPSSWDSQTYEYENHYGAVWLLFFGFLSKFLTIFEVSKITVPYRTYSTVQYRRPSHFSAPEYQSPARPLRSTAPAAR